LRHAAHLTGLAAVHSQRSDWKLLIGATLLGPLDSLACDRQP